MVSVTLKTFANKIDKIVQEFGKESAKSISEEAIRLAKKEMIKKNKTGKTYIVNGAKYRRSAIGEVVAMEPLALRIKKFGKKGNHKSSYESLRPLNARLKVSNKDGYVAYNVGIKDTSQNAQYKYDRNIKTGNKYIKLDSGVWTKEGYLRTGRTLIGYGLYNAIKNYKEKKSVGNINCSQIFQKVFTRNLK